MGIAKNKLLKLKYNLMDYITHVFWQHQKLSCKLNFQLGSVLQNEVAIFLASDS